MKKSDYWKKRSEQRLVLAEEKAKQLEKKLEPKFKEVYKNIEADIAKLYMEFGTEEGLDYAAVSRKLTKSQKEQFRKDLDFYIKSTSDEEFAKKLKAMKLKARITKLEAQKTSIEAEVHNLYIDYLSDELQLTLGDVLDNNYYRTIFDMAQFQGFQASFTTLSPELLTALLEYPWSGKNYSEKLWGHVRDFSGKLNSVLTTGIVQGSSNQKMATQLAKVTKAEYSKALTLIRTETNFIANEATATAYDNLGVASYRYLATLDLRTSEMCRELDGKVYPLSDKVVGVNYPPLHPRCRSTTVPEIPELAGTRIARDKDGKTYYVNRDMTYKEWYDKQVTPKKTLASGEIGDTDGYSTIVKVGKVDYNDNIAVENIFTEFAKKYRSADIEHALVIAKNGTAYTIDGLSSTVGINLAGKDALKGAKVIHNHPDEKDWFGDCFSRVDFVGFFECGLEEMQVVSGLGRYRMSYTGKPLNDSEAYELYVQTQKNVLDRAYKEHRECEYRQLETMKAMAQSVEELKFMRVGD